MKVLWSQGGSLGGLGVTTPLAGEDQSSSQQPVNPSSPAAPQAAIETKPKYANLGPRFKTIRFQAVEGKPGVFIVTFGPKDEDFTFPSQELAEQKMIKQLGAELGNIVMREYDGVIRTVILDFSNVPFFPQDAAHMLVSTNTQYKECREPDKERELRLCNIKPEILQGAFDKDSINGKLKIFDDLSKALEGL